MTPPSPPSSPAPNSTPSNPSTFRSHAARRLTPTPAPTSLLTCTTLSPPLSPLRPPPLLSLAVLE
ncbi:hypothetical protein E2C01_080778 [Portunus trituberculatus]|uniref:Uncharacterized protein n=1 Tax=Portunus trituberculatus TaxID=210409 RepID=A0A5B7IN11_PORTR|nr:hypothetical protein [Portunus trituberculatus]